MRKKFTEVDKELMRVMAKNLRSVLDRKGWTQRDLAESTKLSTSAISDYINAKTMISPGNVQIISDALRVVKSEIDPTFRGTMIGESPVTFGSDQEFAIEDLVRRELTYKGHRLTDEQKTQFAKLVQAAADMLDT